MREWITVDKLRVMSLSLLDVVQKSARKGTLLASCEPEVKELMHQIDVLLTTKQDESKSRVQGLKSQLQQREREMSSLRVAIQEKNAQIDKMKNDVRRLEQQLRVQSSDHETQHRRMKAELNRLSKSYEKLKLRRGLNEEKSSELAALKLELEEVRTHCDSQQSQITQLSHQLGLSQTQENSWQEQNKALEEELNLCREELFRCKADNEGLKEKFARLESQFKLCQDSVRSRDRKIQSLRAERDGVKSKHKAIVDEYQKLQEVGVALSNENQSYQVGVADLQLQLTREQSNLQNCEVEKTHLQQQLAVAQELIKNKEKLIQSLDGRYKQKIESETNLLNAQMKDLQEKLVILKKQESALLEENSKLKEKVQKKQSSSASSSSSTLSPAVAEIQSYKAKLAERDQLVSSLEHKVCHLEDQLSEATSVQYSSSISSSQGAGESFATSESKNTTQSPLPSKPLSRDNSFSVTEDTSRGSLSPRSQIAPTTSINPSSDRRPSGDSLRRVSEHFQLGMRRLATPTSSTPADHSGSLLEMFKSSLDSVLTEHFDKMDKSLRIALEQS